MKDEALEKDKITFDKLTDGTCVITVKGKNMHNDTFIRQEIIKETAIFDALKEACDSNPDSDTSGGLHLADVSVSKLELFAKWLKEQKHEIRGGKKMHDVRYYRWLTKDEMYEYWSQRVYSR